MIVHDGYDITDLGPGRFGAAVNSAGAVAITPPAAPRRATVYSNGSVTDVPDLGGGETVALSINEAGVVAGASRLAGDEIVFHAVIFQAAKLVDVSQDADCAAQDVNGMNDAVGTCNVSGRPGVQHAILFRGGSTIELGTLDGGNSQAFGINDAGEAVGAASVLGVVDPSTGLNALHAVRFVDGSVHDIGTLGGSASRALAINSVGTIVGTAAVEPHVSGDTVVEDSHAFVYENGVMQDIGTLGGNSSEAFSISDDGTVVGTSRSSSSQARAFIYHNGSLQDLNSLVKPGTGWVLKAANGIDPQGRLIVGFGTINGEDHGFLLTPHADADVSGGGDLVLSTRTSGAQRELDTVGSDGATRVSLTTDRASHDAPTVSRDGTKVAYCSNLDGNDEIYVMQRDGSDVRRLTNEASDDRAPAFWPDGGSIVFASTRDGNRELYRLFLDGTPTQRLTNDAADDRLPRVSPDGSTIAFSSDRQGKFAIYLMNADGSDIRRLSDVDGEGQVDFSPDGRSLVFVSRRDKNRELYRVNLDGSGLTRLTFNQWDEQSPKFSPDGTQIAFSSNRNGNADIFVIDARGTPMRQVTATSADDTRPDWIPFPAGL